MQELITTAQAAAVVARISGRSCGTENIRRLAREGKLPVAVLVGEQQRLFDRKVVERFAAGRCRDGNEAA